MNLGKYYYSTSKSWLHGLLGVVDRIHPGKEDYHLELDHKSRILIVRVEHLGDVVSVFPLIAMIRKQGFLGEISLMISEQSYRVFKETVPVDNCIVVPTPIMHDRSELSILLKVLNTIRSYLMAFQVLLRVKYDVVIFPSPNLFGYQMLGLFAKASIGVSSAGFKGIHTVHVLDSGTSSVYVINRLIVNKLRTISYKFKIENPKSYDSRSVKSFHSSQYAVVVCKSGSPLKDLRIDDLEKLLLELINRHGATIVLLIGDYDNSHKKAILGLGMPVVLETLGRVNDLTVLTRLITGSAFVLTTDSFMSHFSSYSTESVPIYIVFYEKFPSVRWKPDGPNITVIKRFGGV